MINFKPGDRIKIVSEASVFNGLYGTVLGDSPRGTMVAVQLPIEHSVDRRLCEHGILFWESELIASDEVVS